MDTNCVEANQPIKVYLVAMTTLWGNPMEFICSNIVDDGNEFLWCGTCNGLTRETLQGWGVGDSINKILRKKWINKSQVRSVRELGEYNE